MDVGVRGTRWLAAPAEAVLAGLLAVGLFASGSYFPMFGLLLSLLCLLPFVAVGLRHGRRTLLLALGVATLVLVVPVSVQQGVVFLLEFGVPALVLEAGLRRGARTEIVVIGVAAVLAVGGITVLTLVSGRWDDPTAAVAQHLDSLLIDMEALTARMGLSDAAGAPDAGTRELRGVLLAAFPGLLFVGSLLTAAGYVFALQAAVRRWPDRLVSARAAAFRWELPEALVWAFIGSGAMFLTGMPGLRFVGLNGLIVLLGLYFLQGLSIAAFLFRRFQLPRFLATLSVIVLVFQPFFTLLVAGLGLFDVWFAFRRLSLPRSPRQT
ncbi:MAG: DUF2232 domain-containing protein [Zetaproteobacteria bacterium]|nr:MAG: DUF2232 domain-containing protein [Zetaproteobacteria bacterium]